MAFLDNSGDIILDAVLTDLGRERLSRGDGSFRIEKFALGDDEIDYSLYNKNHPSGSAYYALEILQTPVLEAFTNNAASVRSRLMSIANTNILYLPIMALAQGDQNREPFYNGTYVVAVDENTQGNGNTVSANALDMTTAGFFYGASGFTNDKNPITVDQGINSTEVSNRQSLDPNLVESTYMIEIDNRFGSIIDPSGNAASVSYIDDDNIASYLLSFSPNSSYFQSIKDTSVKAAVSGPRGTRLVFKIKSSIDLSTSDYLFTKLGSTTSLPGLAGATVSSVKFLDSNVRITGVTTGYRLDIPIRFVKSP